MPETQTPISKLNDTQLVLLGAAAQRDDHSLLPCPENLTAKGAALDKIIKSLRKRNLIEEQRIVDGAPAWRRDEDNRAYGLFITTAGLLALGVEEASDQRSSEAAAAVPRKRKTAAARPRPKHKKPAPNVSKAGAAPTGEGWERARKVPTRWLCWQSEANPSLLQMQGDLTELQGKRRLGSAESLGISMGWRVLPLI